MYRGYKMQENINNNNINIKLPDAVNKIISELNTCEYSAYAVGGCVRDSMLGKTPHDYDICTSATPEQMKKVFKAHKQNTYDTGIQHGTISVMIDGELYESTTYRLDGEYSDGRHPDEVVFVDEIEKDLARRDFTINAMAYNEKDGLIDPFNGQEDLENKIIRCVGNPNRRFQEDGLRIMRAIRFAATYGFTIEPETKQAIFDNKHLLKNIAEERKTTEFLKTLKTADAELLREYKDVFVEFIPELNDIFDFEQNNPWHVYDVFEHTIQALECCNSDDMNVKLAVFFHDIGKPRSFQDSEDGLRHFKGHGSVGAEMTDEIMRRMKFDNETRESVVQLVQYHAAQIKPEKAFIKKCMNKIGEEQFSKLLEVKIADNMAQNLEHSAKVIEELKNIEKMYCDILDKKECYLIKDLHINGKDLISIGMKPGKELGNTLEQLLEKVIKNPELNDKETLLEIAEKIQETEIIEINDDRREM
jgi:tRNA nucleotidyltransferase (CCA-adding enzyme)